MKRLIIKIDEEKCDGCGLCVPSCAEGAIQIVDGKARLVSERYCDGLGACLGECPQGALSIEERDAEEFDEAAVAAVHAEAPTRQQTADSPHHDGHHGGCPGSRMMTFARPDREPTGSACATPSELTQWPVQLALVSPAAPYFREADLLVAADCVPFAYPDFHRRLLRGRAVVVGCPKLDDPGFYVEKLTEIIRRNEPTSLTVAHMEVPCCFGLVQIVKEAVARSGRQVPVREVTVGIRGEANG